MFRVRAAGSDVADSLRRCASGALPCKLYAVKAREFCNSLNQSAETAEHRPSNSGSAGSIDEPLCRFGS
ncbi:hypothetical protein RSSM_01825 [Rhodopirellula sallentina SM41]|uniref:Uncharacterized protein n=1 Tax=Rhodopirellula sallentina SM41 TaxID=1263870 RepID=M5U5L7_9BACT|nr:hypothetical protein RSSM_01825 [Rhodopirellula sallentina SM41]